MRLGIHLIHVAVGQLCSGKENQIVGDGDFIQLLFESASLGDEVAGLVVWFIGGVDPTGDEAVADVG